MDDYDYEEFEANDTLAVGERVYDEAQLQQQQETLLKKQEKTETYIPEAVREFLVYFRKCLYSGNEYQILGCYETSWKKLTDRFYRGGLLWPSPEAVSPLVDDDRVFLMFYKEVYYRHVYSRSGGSSNTDTEQQIDSYRNYCELFGAILSEEGLDLDLPAAWVWDIVDEFVYQFTLYTRNAEKGANSSTSGDDLWSVFSVLNILYSLSGRAGPLISGETHKGPLVQTMGYFAIIGLLKMHTQLGDFTTALKCLGETALNKRALFTRVTAAHFTIYYYVAICYMMIGRYADAIKTISHILLYVSRTRNLNASVNAAGANASAAASYDSLTKRTAQGYAILALCLSCCPMRLDETVHSTLRERFGDQVTALRRGGPEAIKAAEELFVYAAPKFVSPNDAGEASTNAAATATAGAPATSRALQMHLQIFLMQAKHSLTGSSLRPYLSLYASTDVSKLAMLTGPESTTGDVNSMRAALVGLKMRSRQPRWTQGDLLQGDVINVSDMDIVLDGDRVHVAETKSGRRFADWFIRNTVKNYGAQEFIAHPENKRKGK